VALTFNAPNELGSTVRTLDALKAHNVRATFFVGSDFATRNPEMVKRIVREGHELANGMSGKTDLIAAPDAAIRMELERTDAILRTAAGTPSARLTRVALDSRNARVLRAIQAAGFRSIYWSLDAQDWRPGMTSKMVAQRVLSFARPGDIIVERSAEPATAEGLPLILDGLRTRGLLSVTVSELLRNGV
jgi:peptidoglycan-N-acetylmuramic acid deacetylase